MKNVLLSFMVVAIFLVASVTTSSYAQQTNTTDSSAPSSSAGGSNGIIVDLRGIDSTITSNLVALVYTGNDVGAQIVDITKAQPMPNQAEDILDPLKQISVPVNLNSPIQEGSEIMACIIQLGQGPLDNVIFCNVAYANAPSSGGPQKIIVSM
jgi:hypothetical protein